MHAARRFWKGGWFGKEAGFGQEAKFEKEAALKVVQEVSCVLHLRTNYLTVNYLLFGIVILRRYGRVV